MLRGNAPSRPSIRFASEPDPTPKNPLGVKGVGESGTVGSMPAVMNAVVDALAPYGIRTIQMPPSPHRVWQAINAGRREAAD